MNPFFIRNKSNVVGALENDKYMLTYIRFLFIFFAGILFTFLSFIAIAFACVFLLLFYCLYRFIWLFSGAASVERIKRQYKYRHKKLLLKARKNRLDYSKNADRQDIEDLIQQINQHLQTCHQHLDVQLVDELHYVLGRYQQNLNFDKTLHIHAIVTQTDTDLLNAAITELLNDITILD